MAKRAFPCNGLIGIPGDSARLFLDKRDNGPGFFACIRPDMERVSASGKVGTKSSQKAVVGIEGGSFHSGRKRSGYVWMNNDGGAEPYFRVDFKERRRMRDRSWVAGDSLHVRDKTGLNKSEFVKK